MKAVVNRVPLKPGRVELRQVSGQIYDLTRADEPTVIGDPLDHDLFARIQADIRDVTVRAGQSITAGDVVDIEGGEAYREVTAYDNVETVIRSSAISDLKVCKLSDSRFICFCTDKNGGYANLFTIQGDKIERGGSVSAGSSVAVSHMDCARLSDNTFVIIHLQGSYSELHICTVSADGNTISKGATYNLLSSYGAAAYVKIVPLASTKFAAIYNYSGLKIRICTVNGTAITVGMEYALSGNTSASYISACLLASNKIGICFSGTNNYGQAVIATVSGTAVTFGAVATFNSATLVYVDCCADSGDIIVSYATGAVQTVYAKILTVNGTTINGSLSACNIGGDTVTYSQLFVASAHVRDGVVVGYVNATNTGNNTKSYAVYAKRNGNTLVKQGKTQFNDSSACLKMCQMDDDRILAAYGDNGNSAYGTATILTVNGDQIAGSFEDTSQDAIALESGAAGQRIAVAKSGNVQLAGVKAGDRIDSPGVSAYAPLDGWLTVTAEEQGIRQGTYTGNGASYPDAREIILGFKPRIVLVVDDISVMAIITEKGLFGANSYNGANGAGYALAHKSGTGSKCTDKGFIVENTYYSGSYYGLNRNGVEYTYFVLA